jgi:flavin reductase (DIM6/NTAB) family NADH-FMN oxidoreductase RutF
MKAFVLESDPLRDPFRTAMRNLVGGVTVITAGRAEARTGLTATSVNSLSMDPPALVVCINRRSSTLPILLETGAFGVNVLAENHRDVAERFAGRAGVRGPARYEGADWITLATGTPLLADALAAMDCTVEGLVEWYTHAVIIGRVRAVDLHGGRGPLVYWRGDYDQLEMAGAIAALMPKPDLVRE